MNLSPQSLIDRWFGVGKIRFEVLRPGHAAAAAALHGACFARGWDAPDIARMLGDPAVIADGLFRDAQPEPSGFILSRLAADEAEILTIALEGTLRGRGLSRQLLAAHLPALQRRGVARLFLEVEEGNAPAEALYRGAGFARVGQREGYYRKPDGGRALAHVMRLDL